VIFALKFVSTTVVFVSICIPLSEARFVLQKYNISNNTVLLLSRRHFCIPFDQYFNF